jgi:hypothetical protein
VADLGVVAAVQKVLRREVELLALALARDEEAVGE